jgi:hypothetical protein
MVNNRGQLHSHATIHNSRKTQVVFSQTARISRCPSQLFMSRAPRRVDRISLSHTHTSQLILLPSPLHIAPIPQPPKAHLLPHQLSDNGCITVQLLSAVW